MLIIIIVFTNLQDDWEATLIQSVGIVLSGNGGVTLQLYMIVWQIYTQFCISCMFCQLLFCLLQFYPVILLTQKLFVGLNGMCILMHTLTLHHTWSKSYINHHTSYVFKHHTFKHVETSTYTFLYFRLITSLCSSVIYITHSSLIHLNWTKYILVAIYLAVLLAF